MKDSTVAMDDYMVPIPDDTSPYTSNEESKEIGSTTHAELKLNVQEIQEREDIQM